MDHQIIDTAFPTMPEIMNFIQRLDKKNAIKNKHTGQCDSNITYVRREQNPIREEYNVRKQYDLTTIQQDSNSNKLENDKETSARKQVNVQNSNNTNKSVTFPAGECISHEVTNHQDIDLSGKQKVEKGEFSKIPSQRSDNIALKRNLESHQSVISTKESKYSSN